MATLFYDYKQLVMQAYERKKENNKLSYGLKHLTPAKLKDDCEMKCTGGVSRRDEIIVREFCGDLDESKNCLTIIRRCGADRFKPLANYLKGKSENTDEKNIELLAWLIDFPDRPWELGKVYSEGNVIDANPLFENADQATEDQATVLANALSVSEGDEPTVNPEIPENPTTPTLPEGADETESAAVDTVKISTPKKRLTTVALLSLTLGIGGIGLWQALPHGPGACMYWHEDHYESVACDRKMPNARIIGLDTVMLKNFRKITKPDTITYGSIGKVWYAKINGKLEFYTSGGEHPVVFGRRLLPITPYIIDKYILSGMITRQ